jgi:hypothetical protein
VRLRAIVSDVTIRNTETGLVLPSAPEFSEDGRWPPIVTEWTPLRWGLFESEHIVTDEMTSAEAATGAIEAYEIIKLYRDHTKSPSGVYDPLLTEDALHDDFLYETIFSFSSLVYSYQHSVSIIAIRVGGEQFSRHFLPPRSGRYKLLRRIVHAVRWRRQDPVIQLPPDSTHEMTHSVTTGLTVERSQALSRALGLNIGGDAAGIQARISAQLNEEFGFRLEITAQQEKIRKLTLSNSSVNRYRRFAVWHVDHRVTVTTLEVRFGQASIGENHSRWAPQREVEFVTSDDPFVTYIEIDRS